MIRFTHSSFRGSSGASGFTLIEMLLTIVMFSFVLIIAYQGIVATATGKSIILQETQKQSSLRDAHSSLSSAIASLSPITGDSRTLKIDLKQSRSNWLINTNLIEFRINSKGDLLAILDNHTEESLMSGLLNAKFRYLSEGVFHDEWHEAQQPELVELSWEDGTRQDSASLEKGAQIGNLVNRWSFLCL